MVEVRRAVPSDAPELARLRAVMLTEMTGEPPPTGPWQETAIETFRSRLADQALSMAAFVVAHPDNPAALAACAVGLVERRLSSPANPGGGVGYILNVSTDTACRRRGYAHACVRALLDWYAERNITTIELKASPDGRSLYASLGFQPTDNAMRLVRR